MTKNVNDGHRERLKRRFLESGADSFEHHNLLELLLFFGIPRVDTNKTAHNLINRFGSFSEGFDAEFEDLIQVSGVSAHAATLIKLIPNTARIYMSNKHLNSTPMNSPEIIGKYFINKFIGKTSEQVFILCLDSSLNVICCKLLAEGTATKANINIRKIVEYVIRHNASSIVLSHNHPRGLAIASNDDIVTTVHVKKALTLLDINLIDHIIVAHNSYVSLAQMNYI